MKQLLHKAGKTAKRLTSLTAAGALLVIAGFGATPQAHAATAATSLTAAPRITFTFDDGLASSYTQAAPILQKYGISGTNYIITKCIGMTTAPNTCLADTDATYMSWDQVTALKNTYGWNIGSHTQDHIYLASNGGGEQSYVPTEAQIRQQLDGAKADLAAHGIDALDFAAPYGDYNNTVLAVAAKDYITFRGFADTGYNLFPYNDRLIVNQQIQEGTTTGGAANVTLATAKSYIDAAIANNQWLTLTFHNITATTPATTDDYATSTTLLDQIASYVKTQVDAKKTSVVSPHDAIVNNTTNLFSNGTFDTPISTDKTQTNVWATDETTGTYVKQDTAANGSLVMGNSTSAQNSLYISASATAGTDVHLWAPKVTVDPTQTYVIKGYFNIKTITAGEVAYYVDEYDAAGNYLSTQYQSAVRYDVNVNAIRVKNANFVYKPTSAAVASMRMYINVQSASGITGYIDNIEMFSATAGVTTKVGDIATPADGVVDALDLSKLLSNWNKTGMTAADGDIATPADGTVDALDLSILLTNWSK